MPDLSDKVSDHKPISNEGLASIAKGEFPVEDQGLVSELATELLAYRTRPPASSMEGWRTMDSAPKDRPFLAFDPRRGRYVCFWGPIYLSRRPLGWVPAGEQSGAEAHPTQWQPLPIPPEVMK